MESTNTPESPPLSAEQLELLSYLLAEESVALPQAPQIPPRGSLDALPLSFAQQRLWFLDQWAPGTPVYNISVAYRLQGPFNVVALEQSLSEIVRRHEALRTTFVTVDGHPAQRIALATPLTLRVIDLSMGPEAEKEARAVHLATQHARRPFDLAQGPLVRATLARLAADDHVLLLTMHHIVADGWSMGVFFRELAALYSAFSAGKPSPLPELPSQYADFAVWQRQWLQGEVLERQLTYWRHQLGDSPPILELLTDHPRPALQSFRGATQSLILPVTLAKRLKILSRQEDATLFMTLLAAFQTLLYRYTGQEDIIVGSPIAGRNQVETEGLIGFFVNTLALRVDLSGNPRFLELVRRVREVTLEAYAHQDMPFEKLVEVPQPRRDLSRSPLFQVMFVLQNALMGKLELPGLTLTPVEIESVTAKFDLTLFMRETAQGLKATIEYSTDLFDATTITRMLEHFQTLLEGIVAYANRRLSELPFLTEAEMQQVLVEWNRTEASYPRDVCVHELFEAQVERMPDAVALVFEDQQLTYRELNCRANQLAHFLCTLGVGPEVLVGICMERSLEMVVGLLGILKAGGAYVPLDLAYPQERLAFMLEDTQAPVLLSQKRLEVSLPAPRMQVVAMDADWDLIARHDAENLTNGTTGDNCAYVIYTSGSTGRPKGIAIAHRSTVSLLAWARGLFGPEHLSGVLASTSFCFDLSVFEIFAPLSGGGTVILTENLLQLPALPTAKEITLLNTVPSVMAELLRLGGVPPSVRTINLAGESLPNTLAQQLYQPGVIQQLYNLYGPSEGTTYATCALVKKGARATPPIGRPIANTQIYVLDRHLQPVPIGVPGELYIGGVGLARGYLHRPELTVERFIPNPFSTKPGARFYKTGDLARYLPDGNLEFLGRLDHQIKLRGFRIELGEIEAVLGQHPAVHQAVMLAREDTPGDPRLVAYIVPGQAPPPTSSALRSFLQQKLPEYMVPSAFVLLPTLPLTPNGKLDRQALPPPDWTRAALAEAFVAPRNPLEQGIAEIWQALLGVEAVGIHNNFFALGGHSLLVVQVISRLRQMFQVELSVRSMFEAPTVAELAEHLTLLSEACPVASSAFPALVPVARDGDLPLSFAQQRLWFLDQLEPKSAVYNIPIGIRLTGPLHVTILGQSLNEIVRRHEILRTTFAAVEAQPVQIIVPTLALTLPIVDLRDLPEAQRAVEARRLALEETRQPFDLAQGPLVRATLVRLGAEEHVLLLTQHHIVSDGWSLRILLRELATLYDAFSVGQPSPLAELPIQYLDYAVWQRHWLQGEVLETQLAYWKQQLASVPTLQVPTDRPRPPVQSYRGALQSLVLPQDLSEGLKGLSRQEEVTLFMTLLAALQILIHRYTGQDDIVIGSPIAHRNRPEIEGLIGFFVNTLVLRTDFSGNPTFRELLSRVRGVALGAYDHQAVPFEKLVEELRPVRHLSHSPLFQVMFALQHAPSAALQLAGLTLSPLHVDGGTAKFDLLLAMREEAECLKGSIEYNTDLFDASTIVRLLGHFETLLKGIVAAPDRRLSDLPLLTEAEWHQVLVEWNTTEADYTADKCMHELFEEQVERTPDAIAVECANQRLTYRELNWRANQLAHYLRKRGVGPETLVAICLERSIEMIVGLLGILKAGGAYVPLDPAYPKERLAFMLEDASVPVMLTQRRLLNVLPARQAGVCLDTDWQEMAREPQENLGSAVSAQDVAYVMYTSGSTGQPKGVVVPHRAVNRLVINTDYVHLTSNDVMAQASSVAFDASTFEIWGALVHGARLIILPKESMLSPQALTAAIASYGITVLFVTTALFNQVVESIPAACRNLNYLLFGGEAVDPRRVRQLLCNGPPKKLLHVYGPTETTTFATWHPVTRIAEEAVTVPIGRPITNTQVYMLDTSLQLVPVGVIGELYIGGAGLARGYLNCPELTAEKFLPHPFSTVPGARLYKTGDLARYLPDGTIEFLGRRDHQVKVRGFRIELGEIASILGQHPGVRESAVVVSEEVPGDKRLTAYVVPSHNPAAPIAGLRRFLKERLPEYMLPSAFVILESLPLTPNGKIDRRALPAPDNTRPDLVQAFVAPRTMVEYVLADIWSDVLAVEQVGIDDSFFDLGGHSLLITKVIAHIERFLQVELPVRSLFESPTIAQLAARIDAGHHEGLHRQKDKGRPSYWVKLQSGQSPTALFCFPYIGGFRTDIFRFAKLARLVGPAYSFYGLQARGTDGVSPPHRRLQEMVTAYITEMQTLQPQGPYFLLGECFSGAVSYATAQQLRAQGEHVAFLALLDHGGFQESLRRYLWRRLTARLRYHMDRISAFHLWTRVAFHLGAVKRLPPAQWCSYGFETTGKALRVLCYALRGYSYVPDPAVVAHGGKAQRQKSKHLAHAEKVYCLAVDRYRRQPYAGRITVLVNEGWYSADPTLGWHDLAVGGLEVHPIPGNHNTYITEYIHVVAKELRECLDRAVAEANSSFGHETTSV